MMEKQFDNLLDKLRENPDSHLITKRVKIIHLENKGVPIVSIYVEDKYMRFYNEYIDRAKDVKGLNQLIAYSLKNDWETNLR